MSGFQRPAALRIPGLLYLLCLLSLLCLAVMAPAKPPKNRAKDKPEGRAGRTTLVIDGVWRFATDPEETGASKGWEKQIADGAKETSLPALWSVAAAPRYKGVAWYWREFEIPTAWKGQTVRIQFGAVAESAQVWLNGKKLGEHTGGATPFEFNVTQALQVGDKNLLALRVTGDAATGAGIWQGVAVVAHDEAYLADVFPQPDNFGRLTAAITLQNTSKTTGDATLDARIVALAAPDHELKKSVENLHLTPGENLTSFLISVRGKDLILWSPETPHLYALQLAFRQAADILDTQEADFGFRSFGLKDNALTLNDEPLTPVALAPHFELPIVLATTDDEDHARETLRRAKRGGANLLYLNAPPPALLRLADEEGLLVVEGPREKQEAKTAQDEIRALVLRDRLHPSILAWNLGVSDAAFARSVRELDPTRFLLTGAANARQLWAPEHSQPETGPLPAGLLPP